MFVKVLLQQRDLPLKLNMSLNGCEWFTEQSRSTKCFYRYKS